MTEVTEQFDISPDFCDKYCSGKAWPLPKGSGSPPKSDQSDRYDVIIAGAGPAGLFLRLLLARYGLGDGSVLCVEPKAQETNTGHADGIHGRTVEILASLGLEHEVITHGRKAATVAEWNRTADGLERTVKRPFFFAPVRFGQIHMLHQGRLERVMSADLRKYTEQGVQYSTRIDDVELDESDPDFPVVVSIRSGTHVRSVRARYLVGADGAHSIVRQKMGIALKGDTIDEVWGVVDFVPETNFPDSRRTVLIKDGPAKVLALVIPREKLSNGDWLCRIYHDTTDDPHRERVVVGEEHREDIRRQKAAITRDDILARIAKLYAPYSMRVKPGTQPVWWATYSVGQRLADSFHVEDSHGHPRVFLIGDACHTHSPRQGQGLNISMVDSYYLAWRLAYALNDLTPDPMSLLKTYSFERHPWAQRVVSSDKRWNQQGVPWAQAWQEMREQVIGTGVEEPPSMLVAEENDAVAWQGKDLLNGVLRRGRRLFNVPVVRYADDESKDIHDNFVSDGRYRILLIASDDFPRGRSGAAVTGLLSIVHEFSDQLVELVVIQPNPEESFSREDTPIGLNDHAEMRLHRADSKVYETYCVDPKQGTIALVRPDGIVAITNKLEDVERVRSMLQRVLKPATKQKDGNL